MTYVAIALGTGDSTKEVLAAPGAGYKIAIRELHWNITTSAAQLINIGKSGGTAVQQAMSFVASATGSGSRVFGSNEGFLLPANTALTIVPAAAGPALTLIVGYDIVPGSD